MLLLSKDLLPLCVVLATQANSNIGAAVADPWLGIELPAGLARDIDAVPAQAPSEHMTACADVHSEPEAQR